MHEPRLFYAAPHTRLRRFFRDPLAVTGLVIFLSIALSCAIIPALARLDPYTTSLNNGFLGISAAHPLGTDALGRDLFSRMLIGGRNTLRITAVAVIPAAVLGSAIGMISGYFGGRIDFYVMRVIDALSSVPGFLLVIITECALGWRPGAFLYGLAIAGIPSFAKTLRASVLETAQSEFVEAARALGAGHFLILRRHVLHNALPDFILQLSTSFSDTLLSCTLLGYLGIGLLPPSPEWGNMFYDGQSILFSHTYTAILPGAAIVISLICLHLIGNGLRDALEIQGGRT